MSDTGSPSLWNATLPPAARVPRPALGGQVDADVAIVGAGYTGLWTAYALKQRRVALLELSLIHISEPTRPY